MTRVRLPPDPENACVTTIVDSQGGDAALISSVADKNTAASQLSRSNANASASSDSFAALVERAESFRSQTMTGGAAANAATAGDKTAAQKPAAQTAPKEPSETSTTAAAAAGMDKVDSIVLVYDLDRVETFFRLENHWLPLIERCYNGKVCTVNYRFNLMLRMRLFQWCCSLFLI